MPRWMLCLVLTAGCTVPSIEDDPAPDVRCAGARFVGEVTALATPYAATGSEHDPSWTEATVRVDCVIDGACETETTWVVFAASADIAWYMAPKLVVGQRAEFAPTTDPTTNLPEGTAVVLHSAQVSSASCP
jgi:hypothetical protein